MLGDRSNEQWIAQYSTSHQHPANRTCHTLGIPTILLSVLLFLASIFFHRLWPYALGLFVLGWIFQFVGHAFEGKPPEFFQDWRFLFVGVRWWWAKIHGKAWTLRTFFERVRPLGCVQPPKLISCQHLQAPTCTA